MQHDHLSLFNHWLRGRDMSAIQIAREALKAARESFRTGRGQLSASNKILDALAAIETEGWRTIDSAPRDGTRVFLGWALEGNWPSCVGFWSDDGALSTWCDDATEDDYTPQPTHWQHLPKPPVS